MYRGGPRALSKSSTRTPSPLLTTVETGSRDTGIAELEAELAALKGQGVAAL